MKNPGRNIAVAVVAVLVGIGIGKCAGNRDPVPGDGVVVDSSDAQAWRTRSEDLERDLRDREGVLERLRARVAGLEARPPRLRTVYDTVIRIDSVLVFLGGAIAGGELSLDVAAPTPDSVDGRRPETLSGIDVRGCDRGIAFGTDAEGDPKVICRKAPLGHFGAFLRGGLAWDPLEALESTPAPPGPTAAAGVRWRKCYAWDVCPWALEVAARTDRRLEFGLEYTF